MAYAQKTWVQNELIEASDLNNIEQGIKDNETNIGKLEDRVTGDEGDIGNLQQSVDNIEDDLEIVNKTLESIDSTLSKKADASNIQYKIYAQWADIGLTFEEATSLLKITQEMGTYSILFLNVNTNDGNDRHSAQTLYSNGVIPVNSPGTLEVSRAARARAIYIADGGRAWVASTANGDESNFSEWREITNTN